MRAPCFKTTVNHGWKVPENPSQSILSEINTNHTDEPIRMKAALERTTLLLLSFLLRNMDCFHCRARSLEFRLSTSSFLSCSSISWKAFFIRTLTMTGLGSRLVLSAFSMDSTWRENEGNDLFLRWQVAAFISAERWRFFHSRHVTWSHHFLSRLASMYLWSGFLIWRWCHHLRGCCLRPL